MLFFFCSLAPLKIIPLVAPGILSMIFQFRVKRLGGVGGGGDTPKMPANWLRCDEQKWV